ncbi:lactonase family protein [Caulobacter segnis]
MPPSIHADVVAAPSRRGLVAGLGASLLAGSSAVAREGKAKGMTSYLAYVGARTSRERNARGDGINVYRVDAASGVWTHLQLVGDLVNPSFLAFDRTGTCLYAVHGDQTQVSAFRIGADGRLGLINRRATDGKNPVHLAFDATNRWLVIANHVTSSLAVLPRGEDGALGELVDLVVLSGPIGPHRVEQPFSKPHQVVFDPSNRYLAVPDKGLDRTFVFQLDSATGKLTPTKAPPAVSREGAGPRHIAFHPAGTLAYVINELDSTVTAMRFDPAKGALTPFQVMSSLPDSFVGHSRGAEIEVCADGRYVYVSNRGHDSLAVFAIDAANGRLSPVEWRASGGKTPRFFALSPDGRFLFAANEDSDTIAPFTVGGETGRLSPASERIKVGSPVCILFRVEA